MTAQVGFLESHTSFVYLENQFFEFLWGVHGKNSCPLSAQTGAAQQHHKVCKRLVKSANIKFMSQTSGIHERVERIVSAWHSHTTTTPDVAIILGSGLGPLADSLEHPVAVSYKDLPGFPVSTAPGHAGRAVLGKLEGKNILAFQGRVHLYEGYTAQEAAIPVRFAHALGAKRLILTNACGGLNPAWSAGDMMLQNDYINFTGTNPLIGGNDPAKGERFVPMMDAYDPEYRQIAKTAARAANLDLREGTYLAISGPTYAPRAELRMFRAWGADAIGMSTVLELIVARYLQMRVLGLSSVTDMAVADREDHSGTTESAVIEAAKQTAPRFLRLIRAILQKM
jgi:purine-nucleoside phosphorylase